MSSFTSQKVIPINSFPSPPCSSHSAQTRPTANYGARLGTAGRVRCCFLFMLQTYCAPNEGCSIMCKEQRSQMETSLPGTPTSVHLQSYAGNLQMREFSRLGTLHNHQRGEKWRTIAHQGGKKPPSQMSTNEVVAGSRGIMKIQAGEDKNSSMHPAACPQNVSGRQQSRSEARTGNLQPC